MKRDLLRSLLVVLIPLHSAIALDFTPTVSEYTAEGITFRQLTFQDGKRQAIYEPPRRWICRGSGSSLHLVPPNAERADAIIQTAELKPPQKLDEKAIDVLKEQFLRSLPPGAQAVTVVREEQNPVSLENGGSYAITASYGAIGETFFRSVVFVNLSESQLIFQITARKADFDAVQKLFRASIFSWHWIDRASTSTIAQKAP